MSNANAKAVNYFNLHTEAPGYINRLEQRNGANGPFWYAKFCALEGHPDKPAKVFFDLTIPAADVVELLSPIRHSINEGEQKVYAVVRLAGWRAEPFVYDKSSQRAGQLGVNYCAKLIKVLYLKMGETVLLDANKQPVEEEQMEETKPTVAPDVKPSEDVLFEQPPVVQLSKDDPDFAVTKDRLRDAGYRWNSELTAWCLPEVRLSKDDLRFQAKVAQLKDHGYKWDLKRTMWVMSFQRIRPRQQQRPAATRH